MRSLCANTEDVDDGVIRSVIGRVIGCDTSRFGTTLLGAGAGFAAGRGADDDDFGAPAGGGTGAGATLVSSTYVRLPIASNTWRQVPHRTNPPRSLS
jgi:uncharacterized spore protein YtfJ